MGDTYKAHMWPLLRRQKHRCHYCGQTVSRKHPQGHPLKATLDHRVPRCRGGTNARHNLVVACNECNHRKADLTDREFMGMFVDVDSPTTTA